MRTIDWIDAYNIGVSEIDSQHEKLFSILNELISACAMGMGPEIIKETLLNLTDYTYYHFNTEQEMHTTYKYPNAAAHRNQHLEFIVQLNELKMQSDKDELVLTEKTLDFVKTWVIEHVLGSDKLFGDYLKKIELQ